MDIKKLLVKRSDGKCELCGSELNLEVFEVAPSDGTVDKSVLLCKKCLSQIKNITKMEENHFRCLNDSIWNENSAVQVLSYRILKIINKSWTQDLLEMLYLEDEIQKWADDIEKEEKIELTRDSNGTILNNGDTVTIIKDLDVKGAGFVAKRGVSVRNISLTNNPTQIEGRVNGTKIILLSCYLKK